MDITVLAAIGFAIVVAGVIVFQIALALGAPLGSYAMGGAFPGRFPPRLRVAALLQAALLAFTIAIVLSRAGLVLQAWSEAAGWLIWGVVGIGLIAVLLNLITPSARERRIWVPVALAMLLLSLVVALTVS